MIVYLITNTINGKRYVGQTTGTLKKRWNEHCRKYCCTVLRNAIEKYGSENFSIEMICEPPTVELMHEMEKYFIDVYNSRTPNGYNMTGGGEGLFNPTTEVRRKLSEANKKLLKTEDRARGGHTQGLIQGKKNVESGLLASIWAVGGVASGKSRSPEKMAANAANGDRFGRWSVESGHLASLRTPEHQSKAGKAGGKIGGIAANHLRWHVKRNIINPNCKLCKESNARHAQISLGDGSPRPVETQTQS